jgi:hypothetical protein
MDDPKVPIGPVELSAPGAFPKLNPKQIQWIRELYLKGWSTREIAEDLNNNNDGFKVSAQTVADAVAGRNAYEEL